MALTLSASNLKRGTITTGDRNSTNVQEDKRRRLYQELPINAAPLTKMLQLMPKSTARNSVFQWAGQRFAARNGALTGIYTNSTLSTAYSSGGVVGTALYIKMAEAYAKQILPGQQLLLSSSSESAVGNERMVDVRAVSLAGDSSYITVTLLEADTSNVLASGTWTWRIAGNAQAELSQLPGEVYEEPQWFENCCQIFMAALSLSGTEEAEEDVLDTSLYQRKKRQAFEQLNQDMERAFIFGRYNATATDPNTGKPRKFTRGLKHALATYESGNIFNAYSWTKSGVTTTSAAWSAYGWDFLKDVMLTLSRYSPNPKKVLCGDLALGAVIDLVEDLGEIQLTPDYKDKFGLKVTKLIGLNTELHFIQHPLFSTDSAYRRSALIVEPELLVYRPMKGRDVQPVGKKQAQAGFDWVDGVKEGWLCQAGLGWDNLSAMGWIDGMGLTHSS